MLLAQIPAPDPTGLQAVLDQLTNLRADLGKTWILWAIFTSLLLLISFWGSSIVIAKKFPGFAAAVKLWVLYIVMFAIVGTLVVTTALKGGIFAWVGLVLGFLVILSVLVSLPMKVYSLTPIKAVGFLFIALVLNGAGQIGANNLIHWADFQAEASMLKDVAFLPAADKKEFLRLLRGQQTPAQLEEQKDKSLVLDRTQPIPLRHAAIKRIYMDLKARHDALVPGAETTIAEYVAEDAKYRDMLRNLQADAATARKPARAATPN